MVEAEPNDAPVIVVQIVGWSGVACPTVQVLVDGQSFGVLKDRRARYLPVTAGVHEVAVKVSFMRSRTLVLTLEPGDWISLECGLGRWLLIPLIAIIATSWAMALLMKFGFHEVMLLPIGLQVCLIAVELMTYAIPGARLFLRRSEASPEAGALPRRMNAASPGACVERPWRRIQFSLRGLLILVACCAPVFWVGRELWDRRPANAAARATRMLRSGDPSERLAAANIIWTHRLTPKEVDAVIPDLLVALRDQNPAVREVVVRYLFSIVADPARRSTPVPRVQAVASALAEGLRDSLHEVRHHTSLALVNIYCDIFSTGGPSPPLPVDTERFVDLLDQAIEDPSPEVRSWAIQVLRVIAPRLERAAPARLLTALNAPESEIREEALRTVVKFPLGVDSALPALLRVLECDPDSGVRVWCSRVLKDVRPTPACTPLLMEALRSPERSVRFQAADLLSRIGPQASEAVPAVLPLLKENFDPVTSSERQNPELADPAVAATWALGAIAPGTGMADLAREALEEYLRQPGRPWRRRDAEWALNQLNPASAPESNDVKAESPSQ